MGCFQQAWTRLIKFLHFLAPCRLLPLPRHEEVLQCPDEEEESGWKLKRDERKGKSQSLRKLPVK
jgi:hypothetical protein